MKTNLLFLCLLFISLISNKSIQAMHKKKDDDSRVEGLHRNKTTECLCAGVSSLNEIHDVIQVYYYRGCSKRTCRFKGFLIQLPHQELCMPLQQACGLTGDRFHANSFVTIYSCGHCVKTKSSDAQKCPLTACQGKESHALGEVRVPEHRALREGQVRLWPGAFSGDFWLTAASSPVLETKKPISDVIISRCMIKDQKFYAIFPSGEIKAFSDISEILNERSLVAEGLFFNEKNDLKNRVLVISKNNLEEILKITAEPRLHLNKKSYYNFQDWASFYEQFKKDLDQIEHGLAKIEITQSSEQSSALMTSTVLEDQLAKLIPVHRTDRYEPFYYDENDHGKDLCFTDGFFDASISLTDEDDEDDLLYGRFQNLSLFSQQLQYQVILEQGNTAISSYSKCNLLICTVPFVDKNDYYYAILPCGHIRIIPDKKLVFHNSWINCRDCGMKSTSEKIVIGMAQEGSSVSYLARDEWLKKEEASLSSDDRKIINSLNEVQENGQYVDVQACIQGVQDESFIISFVFTYEKNNTRIKHCYSCKGISGQHCIIFPCGHAFVFDEENFVMQSNLHNMQQPCTCPCCAVSCSIIDLALIRARDLSEALATKRPTPLKVYKPYLEIFFEDKISELYGYLFS